MPPATRFSENHVLRRTYSIRYVALSARNDRCLEVALSFLSVVLISMADQTSPTAAKKSKKKCWDLMKSYKKGRGIGKRVLDVIRQPKSANDSASQSNSTRVSVSSASGAHDPLPGTDAGSAEPTASSKYIGSIFVLSTTT
jgi:hypothetical protein